jgi:phosphate transport system substrate-binding protein
MKLVYAAAAMSLFSVGLAGPHAAHAQQINGAGSSFAAPIYNKWAESAGPATGVKLNYQAIGSGAGINQINNRTVDFGASDMPVSGENLKKNNLMQFPTVIGGVDIVVNLPGMKPNELRLTGEVVADIYLGNITKWNDKAIAALNPSVKLPSLAIAPVYRADGSGTTFVFTDYLSMVSPDWKSKVGAATSVKWAAGTGGKGSDGVAATVSNIRGGIGYVESAYAENNKLITVEMKNKAGKFVSPTADSFAAAAANADWSKVENFAIDLNNQPGDKSWPIESATFVLLPTDPKDPAQSAAVQKFFDWGLTNGDAIAKQLLYVTLPASVKSQIKAAWKTEIKSASK